MKKHTLPSLIAGLVNHPYDSNPDYFARINFFYTSPDRRLGMYYWEAPVGQVTLRYEQFDEMIVILDGILEISNQTGRQHFEKNDCLEITRTDGELVFQVLEEVKAVGFVFPIDSQEFKNIAKLMNWKTEDAFDIS
jgi:uncharacterized cupin superfamily protein